MIRTLLADVREALRMARISRLSRLAATAAVAAHDSLGAVVQTPCTAPEGGRAHPDDEIRGHDYPAPHQGVPQSNSLSVADPLSAPTEGNRAYPRGGGHGVPPYADLPWGVPAIAEPREPGGEVQR